ncbi:putative magnesium chelatase subunit [Gordonia araii NBRC 100433]|uniref:Putative magnesium chelatase subunit n=1 Tax=Gordonia araii NBRC 100433 TaxID=1073574 RepID=G7GYH3_9ACTN|nr:AAA family ATPase [Gordonia araii]NNG97355.1 AAA domain-containing protein [Gordonia araii NBRC 100433]GAB08648.1 putative magnesium chelatase subunit [Gordonia araii NBRC 100433]
MSTAFPFTAIVGHREFKQALLLCAIDPGLGGVLAMGDRGTAKSTLVRSLADLLRIAGIPAPVVDLPLGATEDRVVGSLDVDAALARGAAEFRPGLLAEANDGFLYIDEVNLLDDFLVDLLLDVSASGTNIVERDGLSHSHPARFVLVGSGNPEEGALRPQLEDRFGLSTRVTTIADVAARTEIVRRRLDFDADPVGFATRFAESQRALAQRIASARDRVDDTVVHDDVLTRAVQLCAEAEVVGHRGEVVLVRAARALAALRAAGAESGSRPATVADEHLRDIAGLVLCHRTRRDAADNPQRTIARVRNAVTAVLGSPTAA